MALRIDMHLHTSRYSGCSKMDAHALIRAAVRAGLDGVVITEHHHVWPHEEIGSLMDAADEPGFLLFAGFEYTSSRGDVLIYGLKPEQAAAFSPGRPPKEVIDEAHALGAACIAAHPTRAGMGFSEEITVMGLDGIEVRSVNLQEHEQRLAWRLAEAAGIPPLTCSDAHRIEDVGRYATDFLDPLSSMDGLKDAL